MLNELLSNGFILFFIESVKDSVASIAEIYELAYGKLRIEADCVADIESFRGNI